MNPLEFLAHSLNDTDRLGRVLADTLPDGTTVALSGTLGAGKTRLVQALAAACGVPREQVVSPTFVLCQEYVGRRAIYHLDTYRLSGEQEFRQLGPGEYFDSAALTLVEWADRVPGALPAERLQIDIEVLSETARRFRLTGIGAKLPAVMEDIGRRLQADE